MGFVHSTRRILHLQELTLASASLSAGAVVTAHSAWDLNLQRVSPAGPTYPAAWGTGVTNNTEGLQGRRGAPSTLGPWYADSWLAVFLLKGPEGGAGPCLASSTLLLMPSSP
ncbi:hypothetical protein ACRRTK_006808 [Alexandromys fortis]